MVLSRVSINVNRTRLFTIVPSISCCLPDVAQGSESGFDSISVFFGEGFFGYDFS